MRPRVISRSRRAWGGVLVAALLVSLMTPLPVLAEDPVTTGSVASVTGTVIDAGSMKPLAGVQVSTFYSDEFGGDSVWIDTRTDENGLYTLSLPAAATYEIIFAAERWVTEIIPVEYDGAEIVELNMALTPQKLALYGTVTDASSGQPVSNGWVELTQGMLTFLAFAEADGSFEVYVDPGSYNFDIQAGAAGYVTVADSFDFDGNTATEWNFELTPKASISGYVWDSATSGPISGALVTVASSTLTNPIQTVTNGSGFYEVPLSAGTYDVTAAQFGYEPVTQTVVFDGATSVERDFTLARIPPSVTGVVTSVATGEPLAGVSVELSYYDDDLEDWFAVDTTLTDANGAYGLIDATVPAGGDRRRVDATLPGYQDYWYEFVDSGNAYERDFWLVPNGFEPSTIELQHDAAAVTFDRWVTGYSTAYSGGGYVYGRWAGTRLDATFTGSSVAWIGPKQPSYGMADVYIDDVLVAEDVDCYAPDDQKTLSATIWQSGALPDGPHTLSIRLKGSKNPASTGNVVVLDRFEVSGAAPASGGTRIDDALATPGYSGTWLPYINPTYFNKTYAYSRWAGAAFSATFTGTRVAWIGPRTTNYGIADVYIDGVKVATVDTYRANLATQGWREVVWESETLSAGEHTIAIKPTGEKNPAATAANVVIDAIDVTP